MKRFQFLFALVTFALAAAAAQSGETQDTWIISGQSNACGAGKGEGQKSDVHVQMFDFSTNNWVTAVEPFKMLSSLGIGAWHTAALDVAKSGVSIRLTGDAQSGQPISNWDDGKPGFTALQNKVKKSGQGAGVFLWYQGESDAVAGAETAKVYQAKLKVLVGHVREWAKNPQMLAVIVQPVWDPTVESSIDIREAQRQFVINDGNAILLTALGKQGDGKHLSREGYFELGHQIARALLKTRYGDKKSDWPGPVLDAAVAGKDGKSVLAHFAEVKKLTGAKSDDFCAIDAAGRVKCTKVEAQNTRAALTFERELKLPAKLVYGAGPGPAATLVDESGNSAPGVSLDILAAPIPDDAETTAANGAGGNSHNDAHKK